MRKKTIITASLIAVFCLSVAGYYTFARQGSNPEVFAAEEFNIIVNGFARGSVPTNLDSASMVAVGTLRGKLNAVNTLRDDPAKFNAALGKLNLTMLEKSIARYLLKSEISSAYTLVVNEFMALDSSQVKPKAKLAHKLLILNQKLSVDNTPRAIAKK